MINEELEFCELLFGNPKAFTECLYSERGNFVKWLEDGECIKVRLYQIPMLTYDTVLEDDYSLSALQNFSLRVKAGSKIVLCGRRIGKTFVSLVANMLKALIVYSGLEMSFASYDEQHVNKPLDQVKDYIRFHPFFKCFKKTTKGHPEYTIETLNGNSLYGINETIKSSDHGKAWWGHHVHINFQDEIQTETEKAYEKKVDAISELGCIEVLCGIPLITKVSPLGKYIKNNENTLLRLPQYVSPYWNDELRDKRLREYGGQQSLGWKANVEAELIEDAYGIFDMDRVRRCYTNTRQIRQFEIDKTNYQFYKSLLVLEPILNAEKTYLVADIGDVSATEILIISKINGKYVITHNITCYKLSISKELPELISYIIESMGINFIGLDTTIMGKPIYEILLNEYKNKIFPCYFNSDIVVGFETDDNGYIIKDKSGKPIEKKENTLVFSVRRLQEIFYDQLFEIPENFFKLDEELSSYYATISGANRLVFGSTTTDHAVQALEVFAILEWLTEQLPVQKESVSEKPVALGIFSTARR